MVISTLLVTTSVWADEAQKDDIEKPQKSHVCTTLCYGSVINTSTADLSVVDEIHILATAYGWSENQVLAIPAVRRQKYIARILKSKADTCMQQCFMQQ